MKYSLLSILIVISFNLLGNTIQSDGNWSNSAIWSGGDIADDVTEAVTINGDVDVTIQNGESFTVGAVTTNDRVTITIDEGGVLNIGDISNAYDLDPGTDFTINVNGTLVIYGDIVNPGDRFEMNIGTNGSVRVKGTVTITNDAEFNVNGDLTIEGDLNGGDRTTMNVSSGGSATIDGSVDVANDGTFDVSGNLTIKTNFEGGDRVNLSVDGTMAVSGTVTTGSSATTSGSGSVTYGTCSSSTPTFCSSTLLPVELISFEGKIKNNFIELNWITASEINNDYFAIERSYDGLNFTALGSVKGFGTSDSQNQYQFIDESINLSGKYYYRLKQVDFDGAYEFSDVIEINVSSFANISFQVYPNPVPIGHEVTVSFQSTESSFLEINIINHKGQVQFRKKLNTQDDLQNGEFKVVTRNLYKGIYLIRVSTNTGNFVKRIQII